MSGEFIKKKEDVGGPTDVDRASGLIIRRRREEGGGWVQPIKGKMDVRAGEGE